MRAIHACTKHLWPKTKGKQVYTKPISVQPMGKWGRRRLWSTRR